MPSTQTSGGLKPKPKPKKSNQAKKKPALLPAEEDCISTWPYTPDQLRRLHADLSVDGPKEIKAPLSRGSSSASTEQPASLMFPDLHDKVLEVVGDDIPAQSRPYFYGGYAAMDNGQLEADALKSKDTNVMARFVCVNGKCRSKGWSSRRVAIRIRGYDGNGYNAVIYNQRCRSCNVLGKMTLDEETYSERVAYRVKKWAGIVQETPPFTPKKGLPHESALCEGCRQGHCQIGDA